MTPLAATDIPVIMWDLSFSILSSSTSSLSESDPSSFPSSFSVSSSLFLRHYHQQSFPALSTVFSVRSITWWWLLEGTHLVLGSSSTAFQPLQQTICFLIFCHHDIFCWEAFWVSASGLLPYQEFPSLSLINVLSHLCNMLVDNDGICFSIECGVHWWNLFTHLSATNLNDWFSTLNMWCPKFRCFSNFS